MSGLKVIVAKAKEKAGFKRGVEDIGLLLVGGLCGWIVSESEAFFMIVTVWLLVVIIYYIGKIKSILEDK